jgi:hypothetical protein
VNGKEVIRDEYIGFATTNETNAKPIQQPLRAKAGTRLAKNILASQWIGIFAIRDTLRQVRGTEILGTDFRDIAGNRGWVFAFWPERDPLIRICFDSRGELPEHITFPDSENLQSAKTVWEACS